MCMKFPNTKVVILAGGLGSRMCASSVPKPFMQKLPGITCIQDICKLNIEAGFDASDIYVVVCTKEQAELAKAQLKTIGVPYANILMFDPHFGYVAVMSEAATAVQELFGDCNVFICPSDQHVGNREAYMLTVENMHKVVTATSQPCCAGVRIVDENQITALGNSKYDRLKKDENGSYQIEEFFEKPSLTKAKELLRDGNSLASTGFYMIPAKQLTDAYPHKEMLEKLERFLAEGSTDADLKLSVKEFILKLNFRVVCMNADWSDIGSLPELYEIQRKTPNHRNATIGDSYRYQCLDSFFVTDVAGLRIYGTNIVNATVLSNTRNKDKLCIGVISFAASQLAGIMSKIFEGKELTEAEKNAYTILSGEYRNCRVCTTNISHDCIVVTMGVQNVTITANRLNDGDINIIAGCDNQETCIDEEAIALALKALKDKEEDRDEIKHAIQAIMAKS